MQYVQSADDVYENNCKVQESDIGELGGACDVYIGQVLEGSEMGAVPGLGKLGRPWHELTLDGYKQQLPS